MGVLFNLYNKINKIAAFCVALTLLAACSNIPQDDADPLSPYNHAMYHLNRGFDTVVLRPVTVGYQTVVPEDGRHMVSNFLDNLYTPMTFANSVLQGDPRNSFATLWRFLLNSTLGGAGLFDFASEVGLHNRPADFGETLAMYGVGPGPYVVLPIIGPSNVRDAFGRLGDAFMIPTNYAEPAVAYGVWGATAMDQRSRNMGLIDGIYDDSLDPYTTMKSLYAQKRAFDIHRAEKARKKALEKNSCSQ